MVGVGRTAKYTDSKGTTTVKKNYQKNTAAAVTAVETTMPDVVASRWPSSPARCEKGSWRWPWAPACRS